MGETGKGQFLFGNQRKLTEERVVRKISFQPGSIAGILDLCNDRGQRAGNMGEGKCCSGFGKRVCKFIEKETERYRISQNDFGWRNAGAVERRADREYVTKKAKLKVACLKMRSDTIPSHVRVQGSS